ncbi:uncharacterized protein PFLUO_LOCUS9553 [Penicillium psychrofluorescens]|uniref:uncharacterized protein n=1 Tax=Penicillium psychrofluorescens TaxID=3158075 RepID=UPI003CCDAF3D
MGNTVLLLLDIQNGIVDRVGNPASYVELVGSTAAAARQHSVKVIHVVTAFRPGYPESSPLSLSTPAIAASGDFLEGSDSVQVHPAVARTPEEPIIIKRRVSAFHGTELDLILRASGNYHIVVAGLITSGAVLSTVRQASDMDYRVTVLRDLCMDRDDEVHRVLMDKVFARKTEVVSGKEWVDSLAGSA